MPSQSSRRSIIMHVLTLASFLLPPLSVSAQSASAPKANTYEYVGLSGASAQQLFLGRPGKVYIVDKTEKNNATVNGHPAWATEYDLATNTFRAMDVYSNSFCAGGTVLGNGTWLNVGGNQPVTTNGAATTGGTSPYDNYDGGKAVRLLDPCDDETCEWLDDPSLYMTSRRWYPTLETLQDGSAIIIGGCEWGGYVNYDASAQNNPTAEFFPPKGEPFTLQFLEKTMPVNLFPLTWLLPSGNLFIQAEFQAEIFDWQNKIEYDIPDIPHSVKVYPASGGTAMYPLTPQNNWTATLIFCGGMDLEADQWTTNWPVSQYPADGNCSTITPDVELVWRDVDQLDSGRSMGNMINLPDGRILYLNGARTGVAGYDNTGTLNWVIGESFADNPQYQSWYYDPSAALGSRWAKAGVSTIPRMYHSSATLLPDGTVFVSGSNPNADYVDKTTNPTYTYFTQYQVEIFYPDYADHDKPNPSGMPSNITYGGDYFDVTFTLTDLFNNTLNINKTKAVIERTGFSTHTMNMGMRHVELDTTFTTNDDGGATLHVAQLPPNPAILAPGPALFFIVVDGIPSQASFITVGDGVIGDQTLKASSVLPGSTISAQVMAQYGSSTR